MVKLLKWIESNPVWVILLLLGVLCIVWKVHFRASTDTTGVAMFKTLDNLVDGIFVSVVTVLCVQVWQWIVKGNKRRKLLSVFGDEIVNGNVSVVVPAFVGIGKTTFKKRPVPNNVPNYATEIHFNDQSIVAKSDIQAAGYLMRFLGTIGNQSGRMVADSDNDCEVFRNDQSSFIAVGMWTNNCFHKVREISTDLFTTSDDRPRLQLKESTIYELTKEYDYGLIVKRRPQNHPNTYWFVCAGAAGEGTADAAWFLANRWERLYERVGCADFAAIVRVSRGREKSAKLMECKVRDA